MSQLTEFRDHARVRANWQPGDMRAACKERTAFGTPKAADHGNCGGCGCQCHAPTDRERQMWQALADEIDHYLTPTAPTEDLFGDLSHEVTADDDERGGE